MKSSPSFSKEPEKALVLFMALVLLSAVPNALASEGPVSAFTPIKWKYAYNDGPRANTVGSMRNRDTAPSLLPSPGTGYSPSQIAGAYGVNLTNATGNGSGSMLAVVVAYGSPTIQSDLRAFCSQYALPAANLTIVYPLGQPLASSSGWAGETMLDVEWAHAMAPGASLVVVVSPDDSLNNLLACVDYAVAHEQANVVSMSWGSREFPGETALDGHFNHSGTGFVAAAGDAAAVVDWPAASANVLAVGGTSLSINPSTGAIASETAWSSGGGGPSRYEQIPSYQAGFNVNPGRGVPDVSIVADPYTGVNVYLTDPVSRQSGWAVYGGTSVGTPQWAAILARRVSSGNSGGLFQTALYSACGQGFSPWIHDITSGGNGYPATVGYDLCTGLGSPDAAEISAIPADKGAVPPVPTATPAPTPVPRSAPGPVWPVPSPVPTATPAPSATPLPSPTPLPVQGWQSWGSWWMYGYFHWR